MAGITDLQAKKISPGDKTIVDALVTGLLLVPGSSKGRASWVLRFVSPVSRKRRDLSLGGYPNVSISEARDAARDARKLIARGEDPIDARKAAKAVHKAEESVITFEEAARAVYKELLPGWSNQKHAAQFMTTIETYLLPTLGKIKVPDLTVKDFAVALRDVWLTKAETASRVKQRAHRIMQWCQAQGLVAGNPLDAVEHLLPNQPGVRVRVKHQPSMHWPEVPAFVKDVLRAGESNVTRSLLEFVLLTACRSGEARGATWSEIDFEKKLWEVSASRMKAKKPHRVPLSDRAIEILQVQRVRNPESDLCFPSASKGVELCDMVLTKFLRDHKVMSSEKGRIATAHGFRSSFRDWASEQGYARDLAEKALAHEIKNATEAAYHRTDLIEQRRPMMQAWSDFVSGVELEMNVLPMRKAVQA